MLVYKFGGASVKDANAVRQLKNIIQYSNEKLLIVISAMGKTTNRLEEILANAFRNDASHLALIQKLKSVHITLIEELFDDPEDIRIEIDEIFSKIKHNCSELKPGNYNFAYDQIVSFGEILSTKIVSAFLNNEEISNKWVDIRQVFKTDSNYRDSNIHIEETSKRTLEAFNFSQTQNFITQGFIASDLDENTTTLGREGSDYTAALLASILKAKNVTLWKDVAGIYNADPALFRDVVLLKELKYQEMIELAFYGARVIHPKTLKPLKEKGIPLYVKSFSDPDKEGTIVFENAFSNSKVPVYILKDKQVLISISLRDLSFVAEEHISRLFSLLDKFRLKANVIQHSAVSFSVCVDIPLGKEIEDLIGILKLDFKVLYNKGLQLLTIRNYLEADVQKMISGKKIYIEQRSRNTVQFVTD